MMEWSRHNLYHKVLYSETMKKTTFLLFVILVLLSSLALIQASFKVLTSEQISKLDYDGTKTGRQLAKTRVEYSASISLLFEAEQPINTASSSVLAQEAQDFIAKNIPSSSMDTFGGVVALGILKVSVAKQTLLDTSTTPAMLRLELQVDGIVIAEEGSSFEGDTFPFEEVVDEAIRARDNEFHRQVEPLFAITPSTKEEDPSNKKLLIVFSTLSVLLLLAIFLIAVKLLRLWKGKSKHPDIPLAATSDNSTVRGPAADSVDEQSMYTLREAAPSISLTGGSSRSVLPPTVDENGGNIFNSFMGWSFSVTSEGDSCEFDTKSTDDKQQPPPKSKSRYTVESIDEFSIGQNVDVFEDQSDDDDVTLNSFPAAVHSSSQLGISPLEPPEDDLVDVDLDTSARSNKSRLSVEDMDEFDQYIQNLPAPYKFQTRSPSEMSRERSMV